MVYHKSQLYILDLSPKANKRKTNKWDLIKLENFCTTEETTDHVKKQPTEWEKICANDMTEKALLLKICKFIQLKGKKTESLTKE